MKTNHKIKKEYPWGEAKWNQRMRLAARMIPPGSSVIDIGGGMCHLARMLEGGEYRSLDIKKWTDKTTVADFNKGEFPRMKFGQYQYIVALGILEYIKAPLGFLKEIRKYGRTLILSYRLVNLGTTQWMEPLKFRKTIKEAGWDILMETEKFLDQKIFYCAKQ